MARRVDGTVLYEELRYLTPFAMFMLALPLGMVVIFLVLEGVRWPDDVSLLLGAAGMSAFFWFILAGPLGTELRHIVVDERGLRVGRRLLPAGEIGDRRVVTAEEGAVALWAQHVDGHRLGRSTRSHNPRLHDGESAVFVYQERPGLERPGWLVGTRDPDGLIEALDRVAPARAPRGPAPAVSPRAGRGVYVAGTITTTVLPLLVVVTKSSSAPWTGVVLLLGLAVVVLAWVVVGVGALYRRVAGSRP